ncbi:MAG: hypothetical protein ACJAZQ_003092 [Cognaticolwellia sp.]|jgi:hypothetical protein
MTIEIEFHEVAYQLEVECNNLQKQDDTFKKIVKYNIGMFERIKAFGDDYDQGSSDSLLVLIRQLESYSPLPLSYKLACDYIETSGLIVNHP